MDNPGGCYVKRNQPDRETQILYDLTYMCKLKVKLIVTQSKRVVTRGWWGKENGEISIQRHKFLVIRFINSGDLMYSMVTIVNNKVLNTWYLLRE